jgi:hypothetical protein
MKSSHSIVNACVDVEHVPATGEDPEMFVMTDTKNGPESTVMLVFNRREWDAFVAGVKDGEFDVL